MDEYKNCEIVGTKILLASTPSTYAMQKNSPFLELFKTVFYEMRESGIIAKWNGKADPQQCPDLSGKPLDMNSCFTSFIILLFGLTIAPLLFCCECFGKVHRHTIPNRMIKTYELPQEVLEFITGLQLENRSLRNRVNKKDGMARIETF